jgi:ADP-heptose:LPS heptosyltransferase
MVSRGFFKPFFDNIPNVTFFAFDDKNRHNGKTGLWQLFQDIKALNPDAFVDLHNVIRTKLLRFLLGFTTIKSATIFKGRDEKKQITSLTKKTFRPIETVFEKQQKAFKVLGFDIDLSNPVFPKKETLSVAIDNLFHLNSNTKKIGIAPFAQYESKIYPIDLMQKVIDTLSEDTKNQILLFGGGSQEISQLNDFAKNKPNVVVTAGKISFQDEVSIISNLDVMLSMDSGNAHIAAMLGVKVVTLWGATHPFAGFNPFNSPATNALVSDREKYPLLPTSVYGNIAVAGYEDAMRTILPEKVIAKINEVLELN